MYELLYTEVYPQLVPQKALLHVQELDFKQRDTADWSFGIIYNRNPRICTSNECF